jgi:hypothetical protein
MQTSSSLVKPTVTYYQNSKNQHTADSLIPIMPQAMQKKNQNQKKSPISIRLSIRPPSHPAIHQPLKSRQFHQLAMDRNI